MTVPAILVDGDACPVREEVFRVAFRLNLPVVVVSNGSRGVRLPDSPLVRRVIVEAGADAADDWIAAAIGAGDICVTSDIPLAARCLAKQARVVAPDGRTLDAANIGNALASREIGRAMREAGAITGGPGGIGPKQRARFLQALDAAAQAGLRAGLRAG